MILLLIEGIECVPVFIVSEQTPCITKGVQEMAYLAITYAVQY